MIDVPISHCCQGPYVAGARGLNAAGQGTPKRATKSKTASTNREPRCPTFPPSLQNQKTHSVSTRPSWTGRARRHPRPGVAQHGRQLLDVEHTVQVGQSGLGRGAHRSPPVLPELEVADDHEAARELRVGRVTHGTS